jgi:hypothetical protein
LAGPRRMQAGKEQMLPKQEAQGDLKAHMRVVQPK